MYVTLTCISLAGSASYGKLYTLFSTITMKNSEFDG